MKKKRRVLAVDDDPINNDIVLDVLGRDFDVKTVSNGEECLDAVRTSRPELILLDIMMPEINGYEVCKRLKEDPTTTDIPVLLVSARAMLEERLKGYSVGANDYITKPFDPAELLARAKVHIALKSEKEVSRIKSDILHLVSHETRTPLNGVIGYAELLLSSENLNSEEREYVHTICDSGEYLLSFVHKALLLLELQSNYEPYYEEINLTQLLRDLTEELQTSKSTEIQLLSEPCDVTLPLDRTLTTRVFQAILDNAVKFAPEDSKVEVRVAQEAEYALVSVSDQGPGVPPERQKQVFEPFSIEDVAHHSQGQGLSLAVAKRAAELHGGDITVRSEPGRGTTFTVSLPVKVEAPSTVAMA